MYWEMIIVIVTGELMAAVLVSQRGFERLVRLYTYRRDSTRHGHADTNNTTLKCVDTCVGVSTLCYIGMVWDMR